MLQCVAACCSVLQCVHTRDTTRSQTGGHMTREASVAVCCSVLQCVAVCCSVLQCVAVSVVLQFSAVPRT